MVQKFLLAVLLLSLPVQAVAQGYDYITPEEAGVDIYSMLEAHDIAGYEALRQDVIDHIFPSGLPTNGVDFNTPWTPAAWVLSGTTQTAQYMNLPSGTRSYTSIYQAPTDGDCLFVYNFGHGEGLRYQWNGSAWVLGDPETGVKTLINGMLAAGCDVAVLAMPFHGENYTSTISGVSGINAHNGMGPYETGGFTPLRWFVEPVVRIINHALSVESYGKIGMAGKSGGGWTTTLVAAIDTRIAHSYPISGTYPMYLRLLRTGDLGDWEQYQAALWDTVDYLDLYVLGAMGEGRATDLIWRKNDPCCFSGARAYAFMPELIGIADRMGVDGMSFFVDMTATVDHYVSPSIASRILDSFGGY